MRFVVLRPISTIRAAALTAIVALTACSAGGTSGGAPASLVPASAPALSADSAPSNTLCTEKLPGYAFKGACAEATLGKAGGTLTLGTYQNRSIKAAFGKNSGAKSYPFALHDAIGGKDITGTVGGKKFPLYVNPSQTGILYLDAHNAGPANAVFSSMPELSITFNASLGYAGGDCGVEELVKGDWAPIPDEYGAVSASGTSLVLPAKKLPPASAISVPKNGDAYLLVWCSGY